MPTGKSSLARETGCHQPAPGQPAPGQPTRREARLALGAAALVGAAAVWGWEPLSSQAEAGTAFGARVGCSCRYVAGRDIGDCESDFVDGMSAVSLTADDDAKSVTASVPLLSSTTATWRADWGCVLEPYEG